MGVLVTGGAGYIGSHMVLELIRRGEQVVVLDNLSTGFRWAVPEPARLIVGDVADQVLVSSLISDHKIDTVIHFAGSIIVPESIEDPLGYYLNNTVRTRALIEACINSGARQFIFSSTAAVYGAPDDNPVYENAPTLATTPYGRSKLMSEWMLEDAARAHDFRPVVLRYFNVSGADPGGRAGQASAAATQLIKVACQAATGERRYLDIFGRDYDTPDGTCIRDYIHVSDLVSAHCCALDYLRDGGGPETFNCGYGRGYSVLDVVGAVERATGHRLNVRDAPRRPGDQAEVIAGADKIRAKLNWRPTHDNLDEIVRHALSWEYSLGKRRAATG